MELKPETQPQTAREDLAVDGCKGYPYAMVGENPWDELVAAEQARQSAAEELRRASADVVAAARRLHRMGESWDAIGSALGIHRQTAYERFREPR